MDRFTKNNINSALHHHGLPWFFLLVSLHHPNRGPLLSLPGFALTLSTSCFPFIFPFTLSLSPHFLQGPGKLFGLVLVETPISACVGFLVGSNNSNNSNQSKQKQTQIRSDHAFQTNKLSSKQANKQATKQANKQTAPRQKPIQTKPNQQTKSQTNKREGPLPGRLPQLPADGGCGCSGGRRAPAGQPLELPGAREFEVG